jgi:hypothetical protein
MKSSNRRVRYMEIPAPLKEDLDAVVKAEEAAGDGKRWTVEAEAILVHYYQEAAAPIKTLCKVLRKAYPTKDWPYTVVNSRVQYLKSLGCLDVKKHVD